MSKIEEFFEYCKKEFNYGWIDQDGKRHEGVNDGETYLLQSPKELMNSKLGICWDRTELYRDYFENLKLIISYMKMERVGPAIQF